jgi:hypothetical protein
VKEGYITKGGKNVGEDLKLINEYTRRPLQSDEVYIFNLVLCDNDLDRDFECFSLNALKKLESLFLGKTGIFDHEPKGTNQMARIFHTEVVRDESKKVHNGKDYYMLKAKAYMIKNEKNKDLILEIDGGIKKEVSIGCNVESCLCSICGLNMRNQKCNHVKGKMYMKDGQKVLCCGVLDDPVDAYEWSFVAVPAQKKAGVVKEAKWNSHFVWDGDLNEFKKRFKSFSENGAYLSKQCLNSIYLALKDLDLLQETVDVFKSELAKSVEQLYILLQPDLSLVTIKSIVAKMTVEELQECKKAHEKSFLNERYVQTLPYDEGNLATNNENFVI